MGWAPRTLRLLQARHGRKMNLISALALLDEQHPELTERVMVELQRVSELPPLR